MFVVEGGLMLAPWKRKEPSDGRLSGVNREASNRVTGSHSEILRSQDKSLITWNP
jgi:hypothetical protein